MPAKNKPTPKASTPSRGASPAAVQAFVASNPNSRTAQAAMSTPAKSQAPTVMQGLKIAGTGGITKQELNTIAEASGKSGAQVIKRLDDINLNLREKDQVGINLNSGAANMLIREASKAAPGYDNFLGLGQSAFGPGKIGSTLQGMVGSRSTGGYINPVSGQQSMTPAVQRSLLPRGLDLMPSGRETVRGIGKQFGIPTTNETIPIKGPDVDNDIKPTDPDLLPDLLPEKEKEEKVDQMMPGAGSSADLANWATGFKTARSSRNRGPRNARTLGGATRVAPRSDVLGI